MFTGIVEEIGTVKSCDRSGAGFDLSVSCSRVLDGTVLGDSIAVNGVCLTVASMDEASFTVGLAPETRSRTNLESLSAGCQVNLERSVTPSTRMGGHFVQGHVDTTGIIQNFKQDEDALWVTIKADDSVMPYIVTKGYVALDGTSLTVVDVGDDWFNVTLVAFTQSHIVMPTKAIGDAVNIEVDVLGKYVERLLQFKKNQTGAITSHFLSEHGYE